MRQQRKIEKGKIMNQEQIEQAAFKEFPTGTRHVLLKRKAFISGATFALQNQWISVEEALPIEDEPVFIAIKEKKEDDTKFNVAFFDKEIGWFAFGFGLCDKITHWMPIPQLKGGEK